MPCGTAIEPVPPNICGASCAEHQNVIFPFLPSKQFGTVWVVMWLVRNVRVCGIGVMLSDPLNCGVCISSCLKDLTDCNGPPTGWADRQTDRQTLMYVSPLGVLQAPFTLTFHVVVLNCFTTYPTGNSPSLIVTTACACLCHVSGLRSLGGSHTGIKPAAGGSESGKGGKKKEKEKLSQNKPLSNACA